MTNFGADKIILIRLYTSLIGSKIHYGRQAYGSAAKSHLKKLDTIQATALRIATGAYKGTQTFSLEVECNILPLQKRRDEMTLKYWARSASLGSKLPINSLTESKSIYTTCRNRLNWRTPYNIKVQDLLEKHNLKEIEIQQQTFPAKFDPKSLNPKHELTTKIKKTESTMQECEKMAKTYFENNYTRHLQIYTNGSKDSAANTARCAFTIPKLYKSHTEIQITPLLTVYTSELIAILNALQWILENKPEKVIILTDSLSAIQSLESGKSHTRPDILDQILYLIHCIIEADTILLIDWCLSLCNIEGNERADQAAKSALTNGTALYYLPTPQNVYPVIKAKIKAEWANEIRLRSGTPQSSHAIQ